MGVTIRCKKTGKSIDLGYSGFDRLRIKVARLYSDAFGEHYAKISEPSIMFMTGKSRQEYFDIYNKKTQAMIDSKLLDIKIADFCYQADCEGNILYGACKNILKAIGDYDDDIPYGYCGRPDCAKFKDFKAILEDCVMTKSKMEWY